VAPNSAMPDMSAKLRSYCRWLAGIMIAAAIAVPTPSHAQVVVVANGSPITELDIQQRLKLVATSTHTNPSRQDIIKELIDDRIKIAKAKTYGLEITDADIDAAFNAMATRQHLQPEQFTQFLERSGLSANTVKARLRAEITWGQLVRGKFQSSLQVAEADISSGLKARNESDSPTAGYTYTLYPVTVLVDRGTGVAAVEGKHREAENLRGRFASCAEGLVMARTLRDVVVREPVKRSSGELSPQLREVLGSLEVGRLTAPEITPQGIQMFALCDKKQTNEDSPAKREVREQLFTKRFEAEAKKFLDEIRKQAMIEYK
jgi:peptidyl-prolyl cis-trans isomerase SurA